jgi:hypothetical protein
VAKSGGLWRSPDAEGFTRLARVLHAPSPATRSTFLRRLCVWFSVVLLSFCCLVVRKSVGNFPVLLDCLWLVSSDQPSFLC